MNYALHEFVTLFNFGYTISIIFRRTSFFLHLIHNSFKKYVFEMLYLNNEPELVAEYKKNDSRIHHNLFNKSIVFNISALCISLLIIFTPQIR